MIELLRKFNFTWFIFGALAFAAPPAMAQVGPSASIVAKPQRVATYEATVAGLALSTTATDFLTVSVGTTGTPLVVRIKSVSCSGDSTAASLLGLTAFIRATPDSGGTSTAPAAEAMDPTDAPATATVAAYTASPTVTSAGSGSVDSALVLLPASTTPAVTGTPYNRAFGFQNDKEVTLRPTSNNVEFALNARGATSAGTALSCQVEWTESLN
jgi:hypothetical protein